MSLIDRLASRLSRLWGNAQGWRPLFAQANEERIGILCFELEGLKRLALAEGQAQVQLLGPAREVLWSAVVSLADLRRYGVRLHRYLLQPGPHRLEVRAGEHRWQLNWQAPALTPGQSALGQACRQHGTPLVFCQPCDAHHYPYGDLRLQPWFDRPDALQTIRQWREAGRIDGREAERLSRFVQDGFVEIEDAVDPDLIDAINQELDAAIARGHQDYVPGSSQRLEQLHRTPGAIRKLWLSPQGRAVVERLFGAAARPAQTLAFIHGSQQDAHQDTIHLTPFPAGYMCGMWIALQDVQPGSGELLVYPGSHRTPRLRMQDYACPKVQDQDWTEFGRRLVPVWQAWAREREPVVYRPRRGSVLIWHENLLHAGSPRTQSELQRRSIVIHYYCDDTIAYADSTGDPAMAATLAELRQA